MSTTHLKNSQWRNRVGAIFSVYIIYLHPEKIVAEAYCNSGKRGVPKYLRVVCKEEKRLNRVHQCCIVLCHGNFEGTEPYSI